MDLVFATNNKNKIKEITRLIGEAHSIKGLEAIGCTEELPETQTTLEGNALQKARYVYAKYSCDCFADDTGLEVEALGGRPGVYSARYAGSDANALNNITKLLIEMKGIQKRGAQFRTVIALLLRGKEYLFEGTVSGEITGEIRGAEGFGYDPVFRPEGEKRTFAEMGLEEKNNISHRARAAARLAEFLKGIS